MPRFASIDVGSNASRLLIVEAEEAGALRVVKAVREPVRMGHGVFLTGRLDEAVIAQAVKVLGGFAELLRTEGVQGEVAEHRAVVTASARDAVNARELLSQAAQKAGLYLEAISGTEEARVVLLAVRTKVDLTVGRSLLVDLGGGSLELSDVHHDQVVHSTSLEIGTVRLLESFLTPDRAVTRDEEQLLKSYLERILGAESGPFRKRSYARVVGTGGNFDAVAELCPRAGLEVPAIDVPAARALLKEMARMSPAERQARYNLREDRADVIVPALYVITRVADLARSDTILTPGVGLKEGIVTELVDKYFRVWDYSVGEEATARAAIHLGRRYAFDEAHATQVDRLATTLFDRLRPLHELRVKDRRMLRLAALLHDIGDFVHHAEHHKHTQYIIENSDLLGVDEEERRLMGCIARYHRRALPSTKHAAFKKLGAADRKRVQQLSAILRVADALDRGHRSKVHALDATLEDRRLRIEPRSDQDLALEMWTARRKAEAFAKVFGIEVVIEQQRE